MTEWLVLAAALTGFIAAHVIPVRARGPLVARFGRRAYLTGYSLLSLALLYAVILAAAQAPRVMLWDAGAVGRWVANVAMPLAIGLASLAIAAPNPLSFGGRAGGFDPARPGIVGVTRHPLLWALLIWAAAHLLANGDLAHVILFGLFAGFAALGMAAIDARSRARLGRAGFAAATRAAPLIPLGRGWPRGWQGVAPRLAIAAVTWAALYHLHASLIGLPPNP